MLRFLLHYGIHFVAPILVAYYFYRDRFTKTAFLLVLGILIDLDHLLATPIFDANRCSINFHLLHSNLAILVYIILFTVKRTRIVGLALIIHIIADSVDCLFILQS
ncbi:DUF6122 family protein [Ascidiimonas sp. W6]|uniref:DUF6122 family protein n=1 Tax=Ascidiimonas meishanensis TaxID=3128903 RepID=UPI0030EDC7F2